MKKTGILKYGCLCLLCTVFLCSSAACDRPAHQHSWSEWQTTIQADCTDAGERERTCELCNRKETEPLPALGHNFRELYTEPATCTQDGYIVYGCTRCSATQESALPAGHSLPKFWESDESYHWKRCGVCGETLLTEEHTDNSVSVCTVCGYSPFYSDYIFTLTDSGTAYKFCGFTDTFSGDLVIPAYFNNLPVTSVSYDAFLNFRAGTVTLPDTITALEGIPFRGSPVSGVVLGAGLTYLEPDSFAYCENLVSLEVSPDNPAFYSENNCIIRRSTMELVAGCSASIIPDGVTSIGNLAFAGIDIEHIEIPDSVTTIVSLAFESCTLESVSFGSGIRPNSFDDEPFLDCPNLTRISVSAQNSHFYAEDNCLIRKYDRALVLGGGRSSVPEGVTSIYNGAFSGRKDLTSVVLPDTVADVCDFAFSYCENLLSVDGGANLRTIQDAAFEFCSALEEISLPESLRSIEICAFLGCNALKKIDLPAGLLSIGDAAFSGCSLTSVVLPASLTDVHPNAFISSGATVFWCESARDDAEWTFLPPEGAVIHWGEEWSYVDGVPTLN